MCDADIYATGLLLTQISAGLLASVLVNTVAKNANQILPAAEAVPISVPVAEAVEEDYQDEENGVSPVVPSVERVGQAMRRRAVQERRTKESVTISIDAQQAKNMKFDF